MSLNTTDHYWSLIQDRWPARAHLKWLAKIYSGATPSRENAEYWAEGVHPWIGSGEVNQGLVTEPTALISDLAVQETSTKLMRKGALIIALAGQGRTKGTVAQLGIDCYGNQSLSCIDARNDDDRFLFWWLTSLYRQIRGLASDDSRDGLNQEMVGSIPTPIVDIDTQRVIANYLDRETARIDGLIAEKERMLALLEEKRAALISRVVTRGLDPNAPFKPSGQEWLGEIPAHWTIWPLKRVAIKIGSGVTPRGGAETYQSDGVPLFRSQNIHFDGLRMDDIVFVDEETHESMENSKVSNGDVLLNITGASIGRCFYVDNLQGEANVNQHVCIIRPSLLMTTKYLYFVLRSTVGQTQIDLSQSGSGREGLNFEALGNFDVPVPPLDEQLAITEHLEEVDQKSSLLLSEIRNSVEGLKERRAALITAAVTGQIPLEEMTE